MTNHATDAARKIVGPRNGAPVGLHARDVEEAEEVIQTAIDAATAELRAENAKLRKALEDVMKHQELLGGKLATHGTTWHIAEKALRK